MLAPHLTWGEDGSQLTTYDVERAERLHRLLRLSGTRRVQPSTTPLRPTERIAIASTGHYSDAPDSTSNTAPVLYDTTPPDVHITSPSDGSTVKGQVQIQATAPDAGSGLASIALSVDGQTHHADRSGHRHLDSERRRGVRNQRPGHGQSRHRQDGHDPRERGQHGSRGPSRDCCPVARSRAVRPSSGRPPRRGVSRIAHEHDRAGPKNFPDPVMPPLDGSRTRCRLAPTPTS